MDAKVVLITGSSSGIGAATAVLFARRGYQVVVTGSNREKVDRVAEECTQASPAKLKALAIVADLRREENCEMLVRKSVERFKQLDVLVNNAGIHRRTNSADKSSLEHYKEIMAVNCEAPLRVTMEALPHLEESRGNIVFVSSVASVKPASNAYAYRMSKAALSSYAKCLAVDIAPKVRVNIVSPGPVYTSIFESVGLSHEQVEKKISPATLLGRVGESEEIASTIFYLASDEASFVNGAELFVDGGYTIKPPLTY